LFKNLFEFLVVVRNHVVVLGIVTRNKSKFYFEKPVHWAGFLFDERKKLIQSPACFIIPIQKKSKHIPISGMMKKKSVRINDNGRLFSRKNF